MNKYLIFIVIYIAVSAVAVYIYDSVQQNPSGDKGIEFNLASLIPKSELKLITEGVVSNIKYTQFKSTTVSMQTSISFIINGTSMVLDFDKTKSVYPRTTYYSEIYNNDSSQDIIPGRYYYIYDWDGGRIVWSETPKTLSYSGRLVNIK